jgi:hypothetical protein
MRQTYGQVARRHGFDSVEHFALASSSCRGREAPLPARTDLGPAQYECAFLRSGHAADRPNTALTRFDTASACIRFSLELRLLTESRSCMSPWLSRDRWNHLWTSIAMTRLRIAFSTVFKSPHVAKALGPLVVPRRRQATQQQCSASSPLHPLPTSAQGQPSALSAGSGLGCIRVLRLATEVVDGK